MIGELTSSAHLCRPQPNDNHHHFWWYISNIYHRKCSGSTGWGQSENRRV